MRLESWVDRRFRKPIALFTLIACTMFLVVGTPDKAAADDHAVVFAGDQFDYAGVGFFGATLPIPGSSVGKGIALRAALFDGGYEYDAYRLGLVKASFSGEEVDAVYQFSGLGFWSNLAFGGRDSYTSLAPLDLTNRRAGRIAEFASTFDGGYVTGAWRTDWYGSYGTRLDDYSSRVSFTHTIGTHVRIGAEVSLEGDPTYDLHRFGPYVGLRLDKRSELQLSTGLSHESNRGSVGYFRASLYRAF